MSEKLAEKDLYPRRFGLGSGQTHLAGLHSLAGSILKSTFIGLQLLDVIRRLTVSASLTFKPICCPDHPSSNCDLVLLHPYNIP